MAILQSTTISGSINDTGSLQITGSTFMPPQIESALTSSFNASGLLWINADNGYLQYTTATSKGTIQSPASFMGAWSAGPNSNFSHWGNMVTGENQNAVISFGGCAPGCVYNASQTYNGSSWTTGPNIITARIEGQSGGTVNAAIGAGGDAIPSHKSCTEEYNGSSWSNGGAMIIARAYQSGGGTQNALIAAGGSAPGISGVRGACVEEYNGSSWATGTPLGEGRGNGGFGNVGTQNDTLYVNGVGCSPTNTLFTTSCKWNGITWYNINSTPLQTTIKGITGTNTNEVVMSGGEPVGVQEDKTYEYNGLTWVNACSMINPRGRFPLAGSQSSGIAVNGSGTPHSTNATELYTKNDIVPYTTCVWSSGAGNLFNAGDGDGAGSANAALSFGGIITPSRVSCTQEYEGTSWVVGGAMINAGSSLGGNGTMNAALAVGGETRCACTEEYNGSSWSTGGALNAGRYSVNSFGTQNSAIAFGGFAGPSTSQTCAESYNGTSWSTLSAMNCKKHATIAGSGTVNASIVYGGTCYTAPTSCQLNVTEEWDGSSWSIAASIINARRAGTGGGDTVNTALAFGGYNPSGIPGGSYYTELYDGVSWSNGANGLEVIKNSSGNAAGQNGAFSTMGNALVNSPYSSNNNRSQFYEAVCSTTMCSAAGAWSSGANLIQSRVGNSGGTGTQNAGLFVGGGLPSPGGPSTCVEEYDGSTWTTGGSLIKCRNLLAAIGTQDAALAAGGNNPSAPSGTQCTEEYNGTSWTTGGNSIYAHRGHAGGGTQNAGIIFGNLSTAANWVTAEEYNGSSWSTGGNMTTGGRCLSGTGTQNNAVRMGGASSPSATPYCDAQPCTELYDGTSWSTQGSLTTGRSGGQRMGSYGSDATLAGGRLTPGDAVTCVEEFNGSVWSFGRPLTQCRYRGGGAGDSSGFVTGGTYPGVTLGTTEEFTCVTSGGTYKAWSIGNDMITARRGLTGFGEVNAAVGAGGTISDQTTCVEEYNGSTWSAGNAFTGTRENAGGAGTQNAGLIFGGGDSPSCNYSSTYEYDGTNWAAGGNMIVARIQGGTFAGTQNAALAVNGGLISPSDSNCNCVEEYDGSSWSAGGATIKSKKGNVTLGTVNAGLAFGGGTGAYGTVLDSCTEEYNGTSWSAAGSILINRRIGAGAGTQNDALFLSGYTTQREPYTEEYNGFGWSIGPAVINALQSFGSAGTNASSQGALAFGGYGSVEGNGNKNCTQTLSVGNTLGAGLTYKRNEVTGS